MTARHGARIALALGLLASLAGNVVSAHPTALGRLVAAWPPLALLVAIELVTRIPTRGGLLSALRLSSAGLLAVIAAWVSYWHLVELAHKAGEGGVAAHLLPLSVDGLVAVASICLKELASPALPAPQAEGGASAAPPSADTVTAPVPVSAAIEGTGRDIPAPAPRKRTAAPRAADAGDPLPAFATRHLELLDAHPGAKGAELMRLHGLGQRTYYRRLADARAAGLLPAAASDLDAELAGLADNEQQTLMEVDA